VLKDKEKILEAEANYYETLYKQNHTEETASEFFNVPINKLNEEQKEQCEGKLTDYECGCALFEMANNKSPGSDGLTVEFY